MVELASTDLFISSTALIPRGVRLHLTEQLASALPGLQAISHGMQELDSLHLIPHKLAEVGVKRTTQTQEFLDSLGSAQRVTVIRENSLLSPKATGNIYFEVIDKSTEIEEDNLQTIVDRQTALNVIDGISHEVETAVFQANNLVRLKPKDASVSITATFTALREAAKEVTEVMDGLSEDDITTQKNDDMPIDIIALQLSQLPRP